MAESTQEATADATLGLPGIPLRVTRQRAIEIGVLTLVVIIAALIRVLPLQYGAYFTAYDPLFQYRATEYVVENGFKSWWTWHDTLSWYPLGRNVANSAYPGVPFSAAFIYMVVKPILSSVTVYDVCLYFPLFMASLTCISSYYLGKELNGRAAGMFAALLMAINPAFIGRSTLGFFDTETIGIFSMVTIGLFFLRSIDKERRLEHRVVYGVLSGLTYGYIFASWGAARYMTGLLMLYMLILLYTERFEVRHLISYCLTIGFGFIIVMMVPRLGVNTLFSLDNIAAFGLVLVMLVYEFIKDRVDVKMLANLAGALVIVGVIGIYLLPAVGIRIPLGYKFIRVLNPFTSTENALYNSVAENHVVAWASLFNDFGPILVLGTAGAFFAIKSQNEKNLYGTLFFLTSIYFAGVMARLSQILAAPACLMGAYGLIEVARPFFAITVDTEGSKRKRKKSAVFGVNRRLGVVFILLIVLSFIPSIWTAVGSADSPTSLAMSGVPYKINGEYSKDWPETLEWMKANVADDEVVCSWWDYGYWIEAMAGKTTMADGATQTERQISNIGKIMMLPQNESIKMLERYGADYIVVFYAFNPNDPTQSLQAGDDVKWSWMVQIGKLDLNEYRDMDNYGQPTEKFFESTLANLIQRTADPQYFTKAHESGNGFVVVYKIHYPE
ncbi:hypothetical protein JXL21_06160 [Candidatus Bathyarchaeota archaeon]|nr:hypothetical protein [Candidatus Bathyarchaeota archaeon]